MNKVREYPRRLYAFRNTFTWNKPTGLDTGVKIFNPVTKSKEPLVCTTGNFLTWYSCGPTVYDTSHIGHASSYVRLDIIRRVLSKWFAVRPIVALGVTDIDDKIINKSQALNIDSNAVAKKYEIEYFMDMENLNILHPHFVLRVTEHVPDIVKFIEKLIQNGNGYLLERGDVYFNTQSSPGYGKVTRAPVVEPAQSRPGERLCPADFALWKISKAGGPSWPSPWGEGRPGWHIECSVMATKIFGDHLDIHTGGLDLAFPHHENEEAQSCAFHSVPQWVNYWIHTGHLLMNGFKMSKSMKNFITISALLESYSADQFRMLCLLSHYRTCIDYTPEIMVKATTMVNKFSTFLSDARNYQNGTWRKGQVSSVALNKKLSQAKEQVRNYLADDFNTPSCIEQLEMLVKDTSIMLHKEPTLSDIREPAVIAMVADFVEDCLQGFGLFTSQQTGERGDELLNYSISRSVSFRTQIRQIALTMNKTRKMELLAACDLFRDDFKSIGITVKDSSKTESSWSRDTQSITKNKK